MKFFDHGPRPRLIFMQGEGCQRKSAEDLLQCVPGINKAPGMKS